MAEEVHGRCTVFANGRARQVGQDWTIGRLATDCGLNQKLLVVELNGSTLLREEWPGHPLQHGDRVEFIRVTAGG